MKRYRFRLEQVLRVRKIQEDQARAAVVEARVQADQAAAALLRRVEDYDAHSHGAVGMSAASAAGFLATRALHDLKAQAVLSARETEAGAQDVVGARLAEWSEAARRVSALERLDERRREEYELELRRDEDAQVDDLVVSRQRAQVRS